MSSFSFDNWKKTMVESAKQTRTPVCATFELTSRCNLDCKMCYVHDQDSNRTQDREMTTENWKRVFDEAYECGMMFATLTGGECLLRQDFQELYLHLWKKRVFLTVFSNGLLINDEYIEFFRTYKPRKIQISLYGCSENGYKNVTGHFGFEKVFANIRKLLDAKIAVQLAITPSYYMKDEYISILKLCRENGFKYKQGEFFLVDNRNSLDNDHACLSVDEIVDLSIHRAKLSRPVNPDSSALPPCGGTCSVTPVGLNCNAGKTSAVISWDGRMCLCTAIPVSKASVLDMSYAEAWEETKEAAEEILLGIECVGCPYDALCPKCPAMRLTGLYTGHCDPSVCEVTRRLVAAGVKELPDSINRLKE